MRRLACALLFIAASAHAEDPSSVTVIVPVVGSTLGSRDTIWKTSVEIYNDAKAEATVVLSLPAAPDQPIILLTMPAGGVQRFGDVAGEAFGLDNILSPLVIQTLGKRSVRVAANAYGVHGAEVSKPQPIPLVDPTAFFPLRMLSGISYSDAFRANIGLVNLGASGAVFTLSLRSQSGQVAGGTRAVVPPNAMWHMAVQLVFPAMAKGDNYTVLVETGARDTYVYGSVLNNDTSEARFVTAAVGSH